MQKNISRLFAGVMVIVLLSFFAIPASAADSGLVGTVQSFVEWSVNKQNDFANSFWKAIFGNSFNAEDFTPGGKYGGGAGREELQAAYDAYVSDLPGPTYDSQGKYSIYARTYQPGTVFTPINNKHEGSYGYSLITSTELTYKKEVLLTPLAPRNGYFSCSFFFTVPVDGLYYLQFSNVGIYSGCGGILKDSFQGTNYAVPLSRIEFETVSPGVTRSNSFYFETGHYYYFYDRYNIYSPADSIYHADVYGPVLLIPAVSVPESDAYSVNTRPTSITGGNYGIVGDNGQITKVEGNTIVNETNNTVWNPVTGSTSNITDWSYDYSTRTYTVTLENGTTQTITYGDENITIQEGDTVYNVYYLIDGGGSETPPEACTHEWTETSRTEPACTRSGSVVSTCSKCQQTKTESIPALGHDWQVKQTVTTEYDDTGQLVQEGYTIFECSRCHEQYKSADGTIPPGGSTTDPGEDKETIWDKLANLAGSVLGGLIGMVEAVLGKILDALTSLTDMLMERLKTVVETVLSIFDELPLLFGGFLDFLGAVFPFLPPELMTLLTFGVIAVVAIGIFKAVRR